MEGAKKRKSFYFPIPCLQDKENEVIPTLTHEELAKKPSALELRHTSDIRDASVCSTRIQPTYVRSMNRNWDLSRNDLKLKNHKETTQKTHPDTEGINHEFFTKLSIRLLL